MTKDEPWNLASVFSDALVTSALGHLRSGIPLYYDGIGFCVFGKNSGRRTMFPPFVVGNERYRTLIKILLYHFWVKVCRSSRFAYSSIERIELFVHFKNNLFLFDYERIKIFWTHIKTTTTHILKQIPVERQTLFRRRYPARVYATRLGIFDKWSASPRSQGFQKFWYCLTRLWIRNICRRIGLLRTHRLKTYCGQRL